MGNTWIRFVHFILLCEKRNRTAGQNSEVGLRSTWSIHCVSSPQRVWDNFLWVFMIVPVKFHAYICGLSGIWFLWLMETFTCPKLCGRLHLEGKAISSVAKLLGLFLTPSSLIYLKKKCTKPVKYIFLTQNSFILKRIKRSDGLYFRKLISYFSQELLLLIGLGNSYVDWSAILN